MGLTGLVAIAALLALYLLRPRYKQKTVSGTVVWKRVLLQEKRKRVTFDHVLLFILQSLVIALFAVGLAEPRLYSRHVLLEDAEYILVLDASASMRASLPGRGTRFERAIEGAKEEIDALFSETEKGTVSLIVADNTPAYLFSDLKKANRAEIFELLDALQCTLEEGDLEGAVGLAGSRLEDNPYAKIFLFTDTAYGNMGTAVKVVDVSDADTEKNVAVLGCSVGRQENEYVFGLVLGAYGDVTMRKNVLVDIRGADNGQGPRDLHLEVPVSFAVDARDPAKEQVVRCNVSATDEAYGGQPDWYFETYEAVEISIPELHDCIPDDDTYFVYGGVRDSVRVEYWSASSKVFWQYCFKNLENNMQATRAVSFREIYADQGMQAENRGFDIYIFEHSIPEEILSAGLPRDGVVLLADPDETISAVLPELTLGETVSLGRLTPCEGYGHPLIKYMEPARIGLTQYKKLTTADPLFETVLSIGGDPVMLVKNTPSSKFVVMPFSINMSDFYGDQLQIFVYDLVNYFLPLTLEKSDFSVGEKAVLACKGERLAVGYGETSETLTEFPAEYVFGEAGSYRFTTKFGLEKQDEVRMAYVHAPAAESRLFSEPAFRVTLNNREITAERGEDIFLWLAVAALALMIVEWCIQYKDIL